MAYVPPYIDAFGLHLPTFQDRFDDLKTKVRSIFGSDLYLEPDSQDGQTLAIYALAASEYDALAAQTYNSFSPSTGRGVGLSRNVKINGLARKVATYSTVDLRLIGQAGAVIDGGMVEDANGNLWVLDDALVTIPLSGEITVTATCSVIGAITARINSVNKITTPTYGWQTATNPAAATPGSPVETDAELRIRQSLSTTLPSRTSVSGMVAGILALPGVTSVKSYENDTGTADVNNMPANSISMVVNGGDADQIAALIADTKTQGAHTNGTTVVEVPTGYGFTQPIRFYRPDERQITFVVKIRKQPGYTGDTDLAIKSALADWVNSLGIGAKVRHNRAIGVANLATSIIGDTFELVSLGIARDGRPAVEKDVLITYLEEPVSSPANVLVQKVP
jgi:uncharacterized phage protein gp47/JayE